MQMCNYCRLTWEGIYIHVSRLHAECFCVAADTWVHLFLASASMAVSFTTFQLSNTYYCYYCYYCRRLTAVFPGEPGSDGSPRFLLLHLFHNRTSGISGTGFLCARCPSCHPTISVKALKETQSTNPSQWPQPDSWHCWLYACSVAPVAGKYGIKVSNVNGSFCGDVAQYWVLSFTW